MYAAWCRYKLAMGQEGREAFVGAVLDEIDSRSFRQLAEFQVGSKVEAKDQENAIDSMFHHRFIDVVSDIDD